MVDKTNSTSKKSGKTSAQLNVRLRVLLTDEIAFGPGKADLLEAIKETGSISAAGRTMDMSYRRAWLLVDSMNRCFQSPLVESAKGGKNGGGAQVTELGEKVLSAFRAMEIQAQTATEKYFQSMSHWLRKKPLPSNSAIE